MRNLTNYESFVERVNELGFMAFSNVLPGFPSLTDDTPGHIWHTGDVDTDPWRWKDRAAEEKKLAFGCILGGYRGFIAPGMYSIFYTAYHPKEHMEERQISGLVSPMVWRLWRIFQERSLLSTGDIRHEMGVTKKKGGSKVDKAIQELERMFYITVAGNRRKVDKFGKPFGWAANVYDTVENWAPKEWFEGNRCEDGDEARQYIFDRAMAISTGVNSEKLSKMLEL